MADTREACNAIGGMYHLGQYGAEICDLPKGGRVVVNPNNGQASVELAMGGHIKVWVTGKVESASDDGFWVGDANATVSR